ncbi:hypothetical protein BOX15_Mlig024115g1 [Macrostomum lignano]|uniref:Eukaryotic translation initiation factor 3 subunit B n=1 Tax=Macrostomum lignano TaxID=282301 RepID=A0A267FCW6_9PLAT|nr:hypothetical protein BOX15_Mlig024115g1 [Macrostomum lignano]
MGSEEDIDVSGEDFTDPDDFVDDIDDKELLGDILAEKPQEKKAINNALVLSGLPIVDSARIERLQAFIRDKFLDKHGEVVKFSMPTDENGNSLGFALCCFQTDQQALDALTDIQGASLDKMHTLNVFKFSDFNRLADADDEWKPPEKAPFVDRGDLRSWLREDRCHDQFGVLHTAGSVATIYWHWPGDPQPVDSATRNNWTESRLHWSPLGTYLATYHTKGIALWGGEKFEQINRFQHKNVQIIDFSPCERYLVTFSPSVTKEDPHAIKMFEVDTGKMKRSFLHEQAAKWPVFKWSHKGEFFARVQTGKALQVFETPSFSLLDKKSISVQDVQDLSWSPTDNILAYWIAETDNQPARVILMTMPEKREVATKMLFNVADCRMHWHPQGNYLCVRVNRYTKKKLDADNTPKYINIYTNFEVFRMREKNIPVEKIEVTDAVSCFNWEPHGSKFAMVQGIASKGLSVVFYQVNAHDIEKVKVLEKRNVNTISWSPIGQHVVLAGLRSANGGLEFIDTSDMKTTANQEHFGATDIEWDPTGRYVVTTVSFWHVKVDNASHVYSSHGTLLYKLNKLERICQFAWRPRPPTLLSDEQIKNIKKNMKTYSRRFEKEDLQSSTRASKELLEKRARLKTEYEKWRAKLLEKFRGEKQKRLELRGVDTDELDSNAQDFVEETLEFPIKVERIRIDKLPQVAE